MERKFRLPQPTPSRFLETFFSRCRGNKQLVTFHHKCSRSCRCCVNGKESEYPFSGSVNESEFSKIVESENTYESEVSVVGQLAGFARVCVVELYVALSRTLKSWQKGCWSWKVLEIC